MRWSVLGTYSCFSVGIGPTKKERSEKMFYGDYSYELAKERMETAIRDHEHDRLVKQLRLATKGPSSGFVARSAAFITALFR
jgi:hypothetical protein